MNSFRNIARAVGVIYIAGMVLGIIGHLLIQSILGAPDHLPTISASSTLLAIGVILWLLPVTGDAAHGILMFPVLKKYSSLIAAGYLGARIVDAVFIGIMVLFSLLQVPLSREYLAAAGSDASYFNTLSTLFTHGQVYAYNFGMIAVGIAGLMLCYAFYRAKLVPRFLAVWGLVGYAILLVGCVLEVMGFSLQNAHTAIGGLWELFIGGWLIVKGFNSPASADASATVHD